MAQFEYDVGNGTGSEVRQGMNNVFDAVESGNSGVSAPTPISFKVWADTANDLLRVRDPGNAVWLTWADVGSTAVYPVLFSESASIGPDVNDDRVFPSQRVKEANTAWESRIAAPATSSNFGNGLESRLTTGLINWSSADSKDSKELDPNVIQFDTVNGRFEVKKAGTYKFGYTVTFTFDAVSNNLTRARALLRGYGGINGDETVGGATPDEVYTNTPLVDIFTSAVAAQVFTLREEWEYEKTTTGSTEYVYATLQMTGTAASGGFQHVLNSAKAHCRLIDRKEA